MRHPRPAGDDALSALLGVPVRYAAPEARLVFDAACLDAPVHSASSGLKDYLERAARERLAQLPGERAGGLADRVRRHLTSALGRGLPSPAEVARHLAISERTLQRRLAAESTSFAKLLDETRRELALLYLADERLAVYEIALLLGYSDPSPFHRAFRRWTGLAPSEHRGRRG